MSPDAGSGRRRRQISQAVRRTLATFNDTCITSACRSGTQHWYTSPATALSSENPTATRIARRRLHKASAAHQAKSIKMACKPTCTQKWRTAFAASLWNLGCRLPGTDARPQITPVQHTKHTRDATRHRPLDIRFVFRFSCLRPCDASRKGRNGRKGGDHGPRTTDHEIHEKGPRDHGTTGLRDCGPRNARNTRKGLTAKSVESAENRGQRTEIRGQRTVDGGQWAEHFGVSAFQVVSVVLFSPLPADA